MRKFLLQPKITRPSMALAPVASMRGMLLVDDGVAALLLCDPKGISVEAMKPSILRTISPMLFQSRVKMNRLLWCYSDYTANWSLSIGGKATARTISDGSRLLEMVGVHLGYEAHQDSQIIGFLGELHPAMGEQKKIVHRVSLVGSE
ncbi:hypothetical protein [Aquipseudomonas alcaligenes]|nr:hypothetical protein [Pseudomonas alcaligenes]